MRRAVPSYPVRARLWRLKVAGLTETKRLRALALAVALLTGACAATAPAPQVETVGTLAPSYRSIAVAPVAPSTDFAAPVVVETDDGPSADVEKQEVEAPEVVAKRFGLTPADKARE